MLLVEKRGNGVDQTREEAGGASGRGHCMSVGVIQGTGSLNIADGGASLGHQLVQSVGL